MTVLWVGGALWAVALAVYAAYSWHRRRHPPAKTAAEVYADTPAEFRRRPRLWFLGGTTGGPTGGPTDGD